MCEWGLTLYQINYSSLEVTFSLCMHLNQIPSYIGFSAPKLHTSTLAVINAFSCILYMFVFWGGKLFSEPKMHGTITP